MKDFAVRIKVTRFNEKVALLMKLSKSKLVRIVRCLAVDLLPLTLRYPR